ncbi:hypothetical protein [Micromonospora sp. NPDC005367]|uniref:hypothetical protein n=1 Tax=Micromonospora sp. NPDC005367 TaxID=3155590 RepID=UPI0033AC9E4D
MSDGARQSIRNYREGVTFPYLPLVVLAGVVDGNGGEHLWRSPPLGSETEGLGDRAGPRLAADRVVSVGRWRKQRMVLVRPVDSRSQLVEEAVGYPLAVRRKSSLGQQSYEGDRLSLSADDRFDESADSWQAVLVGNDFEALVAIGWCGEVPSN